MSAVKLNLSPSRKELRQFGFIALVVAGLGIANTLLMATYERRREIGLLKALGMTSSGVRTMFALEATVMGLLGFGRRQNRL